MRTYMVAGSNSQLQLVRYEHMVMKMELYALKKLISDLKFIGSHTTELLQLGVTITFMMLRVN